MRIPIREQLAGLILLSALIGLAVVSLATWFTNYNLVIGVRGGRLAYLAALKAGQISSNLNIMTTGVNFISTRVLIQNALARYKAGNNSAANWVEATADITAAISSSRSLGQAVLHQVIIFPANANGAEGRRGILNATDPSILGEIELPYTYRNGSPIYLGDDPVGYPSNLYPNLTYSAGSAFSNDIELNDTTPNLVLGPWWINETYALMSMTTTIINNTSSSDVLGYLTVVMDAVLVAAVLRSREGLDKTGELLIITPSNITNRFPKGFSPNPATDGQLQVQYVTLLPEDADRHPNHVVGSANPSFPASDYPAIVSALETTNSSSDTASSGSQLSTYNENGNQVSVGYATVNSDMVDWIALVEQLTSEVWQPIDQLRNVLLACVFGTAGFLLVIAFPLAHFAVLPIRRLRDATRRSIAPPMGSRSSLGSYLSAYPEGQHDGRDDEAAVIARKEGFVTKAKRWRQWSKRPAETRGQVRRKREFRIPGKVKERKQLVKDELFDLTATFNEMSDELVLQYSKLEERVQQRTAELELSKKAAEVANESKTLFIANISHELKTPLNGILGMCAVCMQEDDPVKLKRELGVIYKSGDLLLNLLNDLLQFTRNQVGQNISLEEREFRLRDVSSQILAIFDKQAKDGQIQLRVEFHEINGSVVDGNNSEVETTGTTPPIPPPQLEGRLKDQILWGDVHRILQVLINLVNNSLKFTPPGGNVTLRIKQLIEAPAGMGPHHHPSISSKRSGRKTSRRLNSSSTVAVAGLARRESNNSSIRDKPSTVFNLYAEGSNSPPVGSKFIYFAFEVQDTGPGIPISQQQRIFEPFVQGDLGLSKKYGGTGLGLSICSQLASLMNGAMGVESTMGEGSIFYMKIPLRSLGARRDSSASSAIIPSDEASNRASGYSDSGHHSGNRGSGPVSTPEIEVVAAPESEGNKSLPVESSQPRLVGLSQPFFATAEPLESPGSQAAAMQQIEQDVARSGKIRVLVAEDNKVNQEVVLRMLKLEDIYDVTVASDGQVALDLVRQNMKEGKPPFNLIFMDIQMPNVDGIQSTKLIREMGYQAPIVALTAFAEESNIKNCLDSGMNYFLSKPIRRPQLKKVLKEYCARIEEEPEDITPTPEESAPVKKVESQQAADSTAIEAEKSHLLDHR